MSINTLSLLLLSSVFWITGCAQGAKLGMWEENLKQEKCAYEKQLKAVEEELLRNQEYFKNTQQDKKTWDESSPDTLKNKFLLNDNERQEKIVGIHSKVVEVVANIIPYYEEYVVCIKECIKEITDLERKCDENNKKRTRESQCNKYLLAKKEAQKKSKALFVALKAKQKIEGKVLNKDLLWRKHSDIIVATLLHEFEKLGGGIEELASFISYCKKAFPGRSTQKTKAWKKVHKILKKAAQTAKADKKAFEQEKEKATDALRGFLENLVLEHKEKSTSMAN